MKAKLILLTTFLALGVVSFSINSNQKSDKQEKNERYENPVLGKWVRIGHSGPVALEFKEEGVAELDFGNDQSIDVVTEYEIRNDTIIFKDKEGKMCPVAGSYLMYRSNYYISFDLIDDDCGGRIQTTMGFWTKPDFNEYLVKLDKEILQSENHLLYLERARIYLATGNPKMAKADLDIFLEHNKTNSRAYVNRAGTRFPDDMKGVLMDCDKAIELEPANKNAYFLRGLALYELGEKESACESFEKAIELGFAILRIAEYQKCSEYWERNSKKYGL